MKVIILHVFLQLLFISLAVAASPSICGDWEPYKDEKCIKIIDHTYTYDEALAACARAENSSTLLAIHSPEEQAFMSNFIFTIHKVVDAIWLGAKLGGGNKFHWTDDTDVQYSNWAQGSPINKPEESCVEMISESQQMGKLARGKWADEPCNKKNLVICQRLQTWDLHKLQQVFLNSRKALQDALDQEKKLSHDSIEQLRQTHLAEINLLKGNPVPIGFTYIQHPSEKAPAEIFPTVKWTDVSATYAGVFFRVLGGENAVFGPGKVQEDNSPHLSQVTWSQDPKICTGAPAITLAKGATGIVQSGLCAVNGPVKNCQKFLMSTGEVRPRNMAVKVWKRTG